MKKTITCILLTAGLTGYLSAQTPVQDKSDKNSGKVIRMDKQMFLDNIFDYTSGSTNWNGVGFTQIVLARELNLEQIRAIPQATDGTIEFFIHGAMCVAYSG